MNFKPYEVKADKAIHSVKVGDTVHRYAGGGIHFQEMQVTGVTEKLITCGAWHFDRRTGAEVDEDLGWGPEITGTYITTEKK